MLLSIYMQVCRNLQNGRLFRSYGNQPTDWDSCWLHGMWCVSENCWFNIV